MGRLSVGPGSLMPLPSLLLLYSTTRARQVLPTLGKEEHFHTRRFVWDVIATSPGSHCPLPVPLFGFASPRQNATEPLKQARAALERWHKAASVRDATWQSAGSGTGTWSSGSICGSRAGPPQYLGVQREEHGLWGLRHKLKTYELELDLTPQAGWCKLALLPCASV